jgi:hypothetical protein
MPTSRHVLRFGLTGRRPFGLAVAHEILTVGQDFMRSV